MTRAPWVTHFGFTRTQTTGRDFHDVHLVAFTPVDASHAAWKSLTRDAGIHQTAGFTLHTLLEFFAH